MLRRRRRWIWLAVPLLLVLAAVWAYGSAESGLRPSASLPARALLATAQQRTLPIEILAGGEVESFAAVEVACDVEGQQIKIVEMLPEGTMVQPGDVVVRLDPSEIRDRLAQQEIKVTQAEALAKAAAEELKIQKNLAESTVAASELALSLAELDKTKYLEGDLGVEMNELQGLIALAETDLQEAKDILEYFHDLVKKGFRTPEQLQAKEQAVKRAEYMLNRDREKLDVLLKFTRERQTVELTAKAAEARRELERAKGSAAATIVKAQTDWEVAEATAKLERDLLQRIEKQLELCDVRAPAAGTLVYARDANQRLELGTTVHYKQKLFRIPDLAQMQVKAFVHESVVKQVREGMPAHIRIDALPNLPLRGRVIEVGTFYDSTRHWVSGGVKEYTTQIVIEDLQGAELKPGMSAEVVIEAGKLEGALVVPIAAVAEGDGEYYCYVADDVRLTAQPVRIGRNTTDYVQVVEGLKSGQRVALDAQQRWLDESGSTDAERPAVRAAKKSGAPRARGDAS